MTATSKSDLAGRVFVLLQGPSSFFFSHLGMEILARGGHVVRVGFCPGDRLYWRSRAGEYQPFKGRLEAFPDWIGNLLAKENATDLVMLGDGRSHHSLAISTAAQADPRVRVWIVEHGYLRPNLILIEPDGMGGNSTIPRQRNRTGGSGTAPVVPDWPSSFLRYASLDVLYHLSNVVAAPLSYPHYRAHSGIHPFREYGGWIRKIAKSKARAKRRRQAEDRIERHNGPLFLFPLQLSHDMQLVKYGTGEDQPDVLRRVIASFLNNAPADALLVAKVHPLDNYLTDWDSITAPSKHKVCFLDGGDLDALLRRADGVVTINSTVGLTALLANVPTLALGQAIYRSALLASEQPLDEFWTSPKPPNAGDVAAFERLLRSDFHVPGTFDGPGARAGAQGLAEWLSRQQVGQMDKSA